MGLLVASRLPRLRLALTHGVSDLRASLSKMVRIDGCAPASGSAAGQRGARPKAKSREA